jgi:hypothetical protein
LPDEIGKRGRDLRAAWFTRLEKYKNHYPELADHLHRLASDQADYLTGVSIMIDAGMTLYSGFDTGG